MIQLIDRQRLKFRIEKTEFTFVKPYYLYVEPLLLIKAVVKGASLYWHIDGKEISYNKIKKIVNEKHRY